MSTVRTQAGDSVAMILWFRLGRDDDDAEEALYQLNPGLEDHGPTLPAGLTLALPELVDSSPKRVVNVWD